MLLRRGGAGTVHTDSGQAKAVVVITFVVVLPVLVLVWVLVLICQVVSRVVRVCSGWREGQGRGGAAGPLLRVDSGECDAGGVGFCDYGWRAVTEDSLASSRLGSVSDDRTNARTPARRSEEPGGRCALRYHW